MALLAVHVLLERIVQWVAVLIVWLVLMASFLSVELVSVHCVQLERLL